MDLTCLFLFSHLLCSNTRARVQSPTRLIPCQQKEGNVFSLQPPLLCRKYSTTKTESARPRDRASKPSQRRKDCAKKSCSEPPAAMVSPAGEREHRPDGVSHDVRDRSHNRSCQGKQKSRDCDEETPHGDSSESSLSADDRGYGERPAERGRSQKVASLPGAALESSSQKVSSVRVLLRNDVICRGWFSHMLQYSRHYSVCRRV